MKLGCFLVIPGLSTPKRQGTLEGCNGANVIAVYIFPKSKFLLATGILQVWDAVPAWLQWLFGISAGIGSSNFTQAKFYFNRPYQSSLSPNWT